MKKGFWLHLSALMLVCAFIGTSCKKPVKAHPNAPTPNNERMLSFSKITTIQLTVPANGMPSTINENYRFVYDLNNRVTRIIYTGNDSFEIHKNIDFVYYRLDNDPGSYIAKTITNVLTNTVVERDTFDVNTEGLIVMSHTPFLQTKFEYLGDLITRITRVGTSHNRITMTSSSSYTSLIGDFHKHNMDGKLEVSFTDFTRKFKVLKVLTGPSKIDTEFNTDYDAFTYTRNPYNYNFVYVYVKDANDVKDSLAYSPLFWVGEGYYFYTEDANRTGDYLQLESFIMYGMNIYNNNHLVKSMTASNQHAHITYKIDAQNRILQTNVALSDSVLNKYTSVYDIQYETY